jgi:hypothetical protein
MYPTSLRWNAEAGLLGISVLNTESGERELQEIELGQDATFAMDMATRERGYGQIRTGSYDMRLSPVGSPPPPWPGDPEFRAALGVWTWHPQFGELRLETNATMFREAVESVWEEARTKPEAVAGEQPVVRFTRRVRRLVKSINKSFWKPVIDIVGFCPRDAIPGWAERPPTVPAPKALPVLPAGSTPAPSAPETKKLTKTKRVPRKSAPPEDPPFDDEIPKK